MIEIEKLQQIASQVRRDVIRMVNAAKSGHPGGSLGCTDFLTALYFEILQHNPKQFSMDGFGEDLFFLSNGHISPVFYSILARSGYFELSELGTFRKLNSRLQGHPSIAEKIPGVRVASGSLGQGLSVAIGAAISKKLNNDPHFIYVLLGDGELEEGQIWEAVMFASAKKINNLIAVVDYNGQQIDGPVEEVMSLGDLRAKWKAFDWHVLEMNGHDFKSILDTMNDAKSISMEGNPVVIIMTTVMGKGVDFMMGTHKWHGNAPNDDQTKIALAQLEETIGDY